jgi:hypothetical protein
MITKPKTDGKKRVHLYDVAIATGLTKEQANYFADAGISLQRITKIYPAK